MHFEILYAFLLALALSLVLTRVMLAVAPRLGLMDQPGERRIHSTAIPRAGGLAIWLTFMLVMVLGLSTGLMTSGGKLSWHWLGAFTVGSLILVVAGILDDRKGLPALVKLGAHVLAPVAFFLIRPMSSGFFPEHWPYAFDFTLFVVWSVVLINAFNLIDGLDGLCGGLAALATGALGLLCLVNDRLDSAILLFVMGGAILGFLKYNFNPARIFLGDAGSMLIGFFLATAATDAVGRKAVVGIILLPIAVAGVPLLDVLLAIWRRSARRMVSKLRGEKSEGGIFSADSDHLHHRLLRDGGSQRKVAFTLQVISIVLAVLAFLPMFLGDRLLGISLVGFLIVALVGIRNLMRVEMEHTGNVIHLAIKLPGHRRRVAAALFVYDLFILCLAGVSAVAMETNLLVRGADPAELVKFIMIFVTLGSVVLLVARVHQRLWVRATMRDILSIQFWLMVAALASFTFFSLIYSKLEWSGLRLAVIAYVFACVGVCMPRMLLELLRELALEARHRSPPGNLVEGDYGPVVIFGAGDMGTIFLDHLKASSHDFYPKMRVLGFIDESRVMHGRQLRSFRILGGLSVVPRLVEEEGLRGIVLAIRKPSEELLKRIEALSDQYNLKVYRWSVNLAEA